MENKIEKKQKKCDEVDLEVKRRMKVAESKLAGMVIEQIEKQREKLKKKELDMSNIFGIYQRITKLIEVVNSEVNFSNLSFLELEQFLGRLVELYENIRLDMIGLYPQEVAKFPFVGSKDVQNTAYKIKELGLCLGQLLGFVEGKILGS